MTNEPILFRSADARRHGAELARLERNEERAEAELGVIARTTQRAMIAGMVITKTRNAAELLSPDGAEKYALFDLASTGAIVNVIQSAARGR